VPDPSKTIRQGAISAVDIPRWRENLIDLVRVEKEAHVPLDVPFNELTKEQLAVVMNGCKGFDGIL